MKHYLLLVGLMCWVFALFAEEKTMAKGQELRPKMEVVFVLDSTGSMGGLIQAAKDKIWSIASTIASAKPEPEIRFGLIGYRDRGDEYVTKQTDLTKDLDKVYQDLMSYQAQGGGDGPESVNQALHEAVVRNDWSSDKNIYKVIFLVGDAEPHMDYQDDVKYSESCSLAKEKGIIINTIQCGNVSNTQSFWIDIAKKGNGQYMAIAQAGGSTQYQTKYDEKILELNIKINESRCYYGSKDEMLKSQRKKEVSTAIEKSADMASNAQRAEYQQTEGGWKNYLGSNEIIEEVGSGATKLSDISDEKLPEELKKLSIEEREKHIQKKYQEREKVRKELVELNQLRQKEIEKQVKAKGGDKDSFDQKLYECLKEQVEKKGVEIENRKY